MALFDAFFSPQLRGSPFARLDNRGARLGLFGRPDIPGLPFSGQLMQQPGSIAAQENPQFNPFTFAPPTATGFGVGVPEPAFPSSADLKSRFGVVDRSSLLPRAGIGASPKTRVGAPVDINQLAGETQHRFVTEGLASGRLAAQDRGGFVSLASHPKAFFKPVKIENGKVFVLNSARQGKNGEVRPGYKQVS